MSGGGWTGLRNTLESAGSLAGNYLLPGSSLLTDQLVSQGSQNQLGSTFGQLAQLGTGLAGAGVGGSVTGIQSSPIGGWGGAWNSLMGAGAQPAAPIVDMSTQYNGPSIMSSLGSGGSGLGFGSPFQVLSGLYGVGQSLKLKQLASQLAAGQQPFDPYRAQYAQQLNQLMQNPSMVTQTPGYEAGLQAVERSMAAQGYTGSGNMMNSLAMYGGQQYQQMLQNLSMLSGTNVAPGAGAGTALIGAVGGTTGVMSSLGMMAGGNPLLASIMKSAGGYA